MAKPGADRDNDSNENSFNGNISSNLHYTQLSLGGGVYYTSKSFGGNQGGAGGGTNRIYAPSWTRLDLFATYDLTDRATLQLNVKNATDEDYIIRTNGVHHADVAAGRQAILALNMRF